MIKGGGKPNPELEKHGRDGRPQTVRYNGVNAPFLNEFLKQRRKLKQQEAIIAKLQKEIEVLSAGLQKVRHRDDGKRFVVRTDEKLTAFLELEAGGCTIAHPK